MNTLFFIAEENVDVKHYNFTITWASIIFICSKFPNVLHFVAQLLF